MIKFIKGRYSQTATIKNLYLHIMYVENTYRKVTSDQKLLYNKKKC